MSEHEVHEIQLNGKQLVFMFMAATVVSVVIFLCGVMVGRGVRQPDVGLLAANTIPADLTASFDDAGSDAAAVPADPAPVPEAEEETLSYPERLEAPVPVNEPVKPTPAPKPVPAAPKPAVTAPPVAASRPAAAPAVNAKPAPPVVNAKPAAPAEPASKVRFAEPQGKGFVIQVRAFPTQAEADAMAARLERKGYQTFVTLNEDASRLRYRVRIGKFPTKQERDAVVSRLKKEERVDPWLVP
jgi:septal ring-binding cell division protein DamX